MSLDLIIIFSVTVFITSIIPGPSMLLAFTHGMQYGAKKTVFSALGNVTASFLQALITVVGLGAILGASEIAFEFIKWFGAGYLIYMGISITLSSRKSTASKMNGDLVIQISSKKMYFQSFFVTAGNPKAIIFFSAVFPQFIDSNMPIISQAVILVSICVFTSFFSFMLYGLAGQKASFLFAKSAIGIYIKRVIGSAFVGSGFVLVFSEK